LQAEYLFHGDYVQIMVVVCKL